MLRTHTCGELRIEDRNKEVKLSGWVQRIRDKGGLIWIDLRDRYGLTQITINPDQKIDCNEDISNLKHEFVLQFQYKEYLHHASKWKEFVYQCDQFP